LANRLLSIFPRANDIKAVVPARIGRIDFDIGQKEIFASWLFNRQAFVDGFATRLAFGFFRAVGHKAVFVW
jgi:hypothetical protein